MKTILNNAAIYTLGFIVSVWGNLAYAAQANPSSNVQGVVTQKSPAYQAQQIFIEGNRLWREGDNASALEKYKQALALRPDWDAAQTMVDALTQQVAPHEWLETHPDDGNAWMFIFAELINSNRLDEAREHLKKIPPGRDPRQYEQAIDARARAIAVGSRDSSPENHNE